MRQCKCGGLVKEHVLTGNRVAWTCQGCARYEVQDTGKVQTKDGAQSAPQQQRSDSGTNADNV